MTKVKGHVCIYVNQSDWTIKYLQQVQTSNRLDTGPSRFALVGVATRDYLVASTTGFNYIIINYAHDQTKKTELMRMGAGIWASMESIDTPSASIDRPRLAAAGYPLTQLFNDIFTQFSLCLPSLD